MSDAFLADNVDTTVDNGQFVQHVICIVQCIAVSVSWPRKTRATDMLFLSAASLLVFMATPPQVVGSTLLTHCYSVHKHSIHSDNICFLCLSAIELSKAIADSMVDKNDFEAWECGG